MLCVELLNAFCGTLKAALIFHKKLRKDLETEGFETNPCDFCVANKMLNSKQMTAIWHADDLKMSHVDPQEANTMTDFSRVKHEDDIGKMKVS